MTKVSKAFSVDKSSYTLGNKIQWPPLPVLREGKSILSLARTIRQARAARISALFKMTLAGPFARASNEDGRLFSPLSRPPLLALAGRETAKKSALNK